MRSPTPRGKPTTAVEPDGVASGREQHRQRVIEAAAELLERGGRDAVTTRAVAEAAGLQPPAIYRLFGDKDGLLEAVAQFGFAKFVASKKVDPDPADPIDDLRAGWDLAVEFGLSNPALYTLMYSEPAGRESSAFRAGLEILRGRVRPARRGWLVTCRRATRGRDHSRHRSGRGPHVVVPAGARADSGSAHGSARGHGHGRHQRAPGRAGHRTGGRGPRPARHPPRGNDTHRRRAATSPGVAGPARSRPRHIAPHRTGQPTSPDGAISPDHKTPEMIRAATYPDGR